MERRDFIGLTLGAAAASLISGTAKAHESNWTQYNLPATGAWIDISYWEWNDRFMAGNLVYREGEHHHTLEFLPNVMIDLTHDSKIIQFEFMREEDFRRFMNFYAYQIDYIEKDTIPFQEYWMKVDKHRGKDWKESKVAVRGHTKYIAMIDEQHEREANGV